MKYQVIRTDTADAGIIEVRLLEENSFLRP